MATELQVQAPSVSPDSAQMHVKVDTLGQADDLQRFNSGSQSLHSMRTGRNYHKSKRNIDYDEKEAKYLDKVTDANVGFGVEEIGHQISKYDSNLLNAPFKICCCFPGSFCYFLGKSKMLLFEALFYVIIFLVIVFVTATNKYNIIPNVVVESGSLGTLVAFLLGLYVALHLSRWWRLRTDGIGNIWSATSGMATLLGPRYEMFRDHHIETKGDKDVLKRILVHFKRIQRYCQTSLALVFSANGQEGFTREELVARGIMSEVEDQNLQKKKENSKKKGYVSLGADIKQKMKKKGRKASEDAHPSDRETFNVGIPGSYPEYMWSLINRELEILKDEAPTFMSSSLELSLQTQVLKGRSGAGLIAAQLGAQLPLTYAHGVTLLGKVYNVILAVTSGITFINLYVADLKAANPGKYNGLATDEIIDEASMFFTFNAIMSCFMLLIKTITISMLLVLCEHLSNPFDDDIISFPGLRYVKWIFMDFEILLGFSIRNQYKRLLDGSYDNKVKMDETTVDELALTYGLSTRDLYNSKVDSPNIVSPSKNLSPDSTASPNDEMERTFTEVP
eukprot:146548_1